MENFILGLEILGHLATNDGDEDGDDVEIDDGPMKTRRYHL